MMTIAKVREIVLAQDLGTDDKVCLQLENTSSESLRAWLYQQLGNLVSKYREEFIATRGVTCFSELNDNQLMWSHYGDKHQGICLEFDTSHKAFEKCRPVRYRSKIPQIDCRNLFAGKDLSNLFDDLFCIKSKDWEYEREWRAFHMRANTEYGYGDALKSVFFESKIDPAYREIICSIMICHTPEVRFYNGEISQVDFHIKFSELKYIPRSNMASKIDK